MDHVPRRLANGLLAIETESNQLNIYELNTSQLRHQFTFSDPVSFQAFSLDGSRLFVMTVSQTVYVLDLNAKN